MFRLIRPITLTVVALAMASAAIAIPAQATPGSSIVFTTSTTAKVGEYNLLTVSITSDDGVTQPVGGVVFRNGQGQIIGTADTSRGSSVANSVAVLPWWPTQQTSYSFTAQYNAAAGTPITGSVTQAPISILATPSGQSVAMSAPQMYLGVPATITASIYPSSLEGSIGFTGNGWGLGASVPVTHGNAVFTFIPGSLGWQQFGASFTSTNSPGTQGQVAQWVNVLPISALPATTPEPITTSVPVPAAANATTRKPTRKPLRHPTQHTAAARR